MSSHAFLFLDRSFASDQTRMDTMINYYKKSDGKYQVGLDFNVFMGINTFKVASFPRRNRKFKK